MKSIANLCRTGLKSRVTAIIGAQWGDEGKGKLTDILAENYDICARFNGGDNAGHTIIVGDKRFAFHILPSGMLNMKTINVVGNGVVVNLKSLKKELDALTEKNVDYEGRLLISDRAHLTVQVHIDADKGQETEAGKKQIGTTQKGIGPTYATKMRRTGLRVCDLNNFETFKEKYNDLLKSFGKNPNDYPGELDTLLQMREFLLKKNMISDTIGLINKSLKDNKRILLEGANATLLDIDFGTYPYVTSSSTSIGGSITGLGIPPSVVETVIGICKAYNTRVGSGPFPTECSSSGDTDVGEDIGARGKEFGVTTGRKRRVGWFDVNVLKYSHMVNGFSSINLTKLDIFSPLKQLKIGVGYKKKDGTLFTGSFPASLEELAEMECIWEILPGYK